ADRLAEPVIAPRGARLWLHALLDDGPGTVARHHEPVEVQREPVLHGGAVHLRHQPAGACQRRAVQTRPIAQSDQLSGRLPRMTSPPAADGDTQLLLAARQTAFERAENAGGDPRRV